MRKNMDGIKSTPPAEDGIHLCNGITLRIKNMDLDPGFNPPDQCLQIGQVPHDKGNFIPWRTGNRGEILKNSSRNQAGACELIGKYVGHGYREMIVH